MKKHNAKSNARFNTGVVKWGAIVILTLLAITCLPSLGEHPELALLACGMVLPVGLSNRRMLLEPDKGGGTGSFEDTMLKGVKGLGDQINLLTKNYDNLDASTKKSFEDLGKKISDDSAGFEARLAAVQKVQVQLAREQRQAFADPRQRVLGSPEKKACIAAAVFRAAGRPVPESISKALGEDSSPGSTLISEELATDVYDLLLRYGAWSSLGVRRIGTKTNKLPIKSARPVANFILTEGGQISDDTAKAGSSVTLEPEVIGVLLNVSRQLIDDADIDISMDVMDDFVEALNYRLDFAAFQGSGAADATHGGITGLFNFGTAAAAAAGNTSVEALDFDDVLRCLTTVDAAVLQRSPRWWIHPTIFARMLAIKDGNGRPIFLPANEAPSLGGIGSILGFPVTLVGAAPSTNAAEAKVAAFGDPQSFAVGVRKDFELATSDQFKWDTFQISFRGVGRADAIGRVATGSAILTLPAA